MLFSLLITAYVLYLYFNLKNERTAEASKHVTSIAELESAIQRLDARVASIVAKLMTSEK